MYSNEMYHAALNILSTREEQLNNYDDELYHHGILGQKWGVRRYQNEDGSVTPAGRKRYYVGNREKKAVYKTFSKAKRDQDVSDKIFSITRADKKALNEANDILRNRANNQKALNEEANQLFKGLNDNEDMMNYYSATSEIADYIDNFSDSLTMEDVGNAGFMALFEDGQQGSINAYSMWAHDNGLNKELQDLNKRFKDNDKGAKEAATKVVQNALDDVGGQNLKAYTTSDYSAAEALVDRLTNSKYDLWDDDKYAWYVDDASYGLTQINSSKDSQNNIKKAHNISSHIKNNTESNTWYFLNNACENLGLDQKKPDELTPSDWNAINNEIAELKKKNGNRNN